MAGTEQVGPGHGSHHERAAGEEGQLAAVRVEKEVAEVLRGVAGRVDGTKPKRPDRDLVAVTQLTVGTGDATVGRHHERAASGRAHVGAAGEKVIVHVGVEAGHQRPAPLGGRGEVAVDVASRVDDHGLATLLSTTM